MSSRDQSNRPPSRPGNGTEPDPTTGSRPTAPQAGNDFFNIDPAEIDRYLSGRQPRQADTGSERTSRSRTTRSGTARQLEQLQLSVSRAARSRRRPEGSEPDATDGASIERHLDTAAPAGQTSYVAEPETPRANRRRRITWRDPYVDEDDQETATYDAARFGSRYVDEDEIDAIDDVEPRAWVDADPAYDEVDDAAPEFARSASRQRVTRPSFQRPNLQRPVLPPAIARADLINDAPALAFIGFASLSLVIMAIIVANRIGTLNPVIATHISASNVADQFASRSTIWHVPLLATMLTLMNLVAAWFISPLDRFASRFLLATSVIVQFVAWVALIRFLW